ncbi:MAG: nucleoside deaminase [Pseudomonadota bacterium]
MEKAEGQVDPIDTQHMALALEEAKQGLAEGGFPVGAVLARGQTVLAQGHNLTAQLGDPTAHGETVCLRGAPDGDLSDATLYSTLSPCIMCAGTILWLGVGRVVIGDAQHYTGNESFLEQNGVDVLVQNDEACLALFRTYLQDNPDKQSLLAP